MKKFILRRKNGVARSVFRIPYMRVTMNPKKAAHVYQHRAGLERHKQSVWRRNAETIRKAGLPVRRQPTFKRKPKAKKAKRTIKRKYGTGGLKGLGYKMRFR